MTTTHRWRAFALLAVAYFVTIADLAIVNVALPTIGRKLHFSESNLQWVVTAYALTFGGILLLGGRAADLLGRRRIFTIGLGVFIVSMVLMYAVKATGSDCGPRTTLDSDASYTLAQPATAAARSAQTVGATTPLSNGWPLWAYVLLALAGGVLGGAVLSRFGRRRGA